MTLVVVLVVCMPTHIHGYNSQRPATKSTDSFADSWLRLEVYRGLFDNRTESGRKVINATHMDTPLLISTHDWPSREVPAGHGPHDEAPGLE